MTSSVTICARAGRLTSSQIVEPALVEIVAYSAMEEYELADYAIGATSMVPDIHLRIERMSTAALKERLLAEAGDPGNDIILGWAATAAVDEKIDGLLARYTPEGASPFRAGARQFPWFAPSGFLPAFCLDRAWLDKSAAKPPGSWADLSAPVFRDALAMPLPSSSGAAFLQVVAVLQTLGDDDGWRLWASVVGNVKHFCKSAFDPCLALLSGQCGIAATVSTAATRVVRENPQIEAVIPADGAGFEPEIFALMRGSRFPAQSRRVLDWMSSEAAVALYRQYGKVVLGESGRFSFSSFKDAHIAPFAVDFLAAANNRAAILSAWEDRVFAAQGD